MAEESKRASHTNFQILLFIFVLCFSCALILGVVAYSLETPQQNAKDFDQSKQMLIAAKILNHAGFFQILDGEGTTQKARFDSDQKILVADPAAPKAAAEQIKEIASLRIRPLLANKGGEVFTFEERDLTLSDYLTENKKSGYANLPYKLFYAILPNDKNSADITGEEVAKDLSKAYAFVIPVSGFGLWAPIYGFIALAPDGDTVIGTTWYEHGETPGLGANITEQWWQKQFYGKLIFQESPGGKTDFQTADMGIIVVKGKVKDVFGNSPKARSAVDGMSGATITGVGVTEAYRNSLGPYRNFLIRLHEAAKKEEKNG